MTNVVAPTETIITATTTTSTVTTARPLALETVKLVRRFGDFTAVSDINLQIRVGQFFGFLGPNGAGKSTTIKMLTGLLAPTSGRISVFGRDLKAEPLEVKRRIGVVPEDLNLFERLTGEEMLIFTGRMYGVDRTETFERSRELLALMELDNNSKKLIVEYSHGMKKKLALCCALIHRPEMLFLDEPFEGVDAIASRILKDLLSSLTKSGITVFLTSHVLETVERLCTDIAIISSGRIVAAGALKELRQHSSNNSSLVGDDEPQHQDGTAPPPISLEDYFIQVVGGARPATDDESLQWLRR